MYYWEGFDVLKELNIFFFPRNSIDLADTSFLYL